MIIETLAMKLSGFLYLFILGTNGASVTLGNRIDEPEEDVIDKLRTINDDPKRFRKSIVIALISHLSIIAIAGMLYFAFNQDSKSLALTGTIFRLGEGLILSYNEIESLSLLNIAKEYAVAGDAEKITLNISSRKTIHKKSFRFIFGLNLLSIGTLAYCILFLFSGAIPILIGGLGLGSSVFSVFGASIKLAKPNFEILYKIGLPLMILFEITFGVWLLFSQSII